MLIPGALGAGITAVKGMLMDNNKVKAVLGFTIGFSLAIFAVDPLLHATGLDKSVYYGITMFALGYGGASILDAAVEAMQKGLAKKLGGGEE